MAASAADVAAEAFSAWRCVLRNGRADVLVVQQPAGGVPGMTMGELMMATYKNLITAIIPAEPGTTVLVANWSMGGLRLEEFKVIAWRVTAYDFESGEVTDGAGADVLPICPGNRLTWMYAVSRGDSGWISPRFGSFHTAEEFGKAIQEHTDEVIRSQKLPARHARERWEEYAHLYEDGPI